jgi:hypothetical protein
MKKKVLTQINTLAKSIIASENIDIAMAKNTIIRLYEKLSVLEFLETSVEAEFDKPETAAIDSKTYREKNWFQDPEPVPQPQHEDALVEPLMEKIKDIVAQMPRETQKVDELLNELLPKRTTTNELEDFASTYQEMPVFERKEKEGKPSFSESKPSSTEKPTSLNDKLNQRINIGLNDRIAFIKHLFESKEEDFTRVLSQINTMSSYQEVCSFIANNVKPAYNNWAGKNEYEERFLGIVEKRFI